MNNKKSLPLALLAIAITVGALWFTNRAVTPQEATWEDVKTEAQVGGYKLINTEELAKRYAQDSGSLLLVDTRQDWEYRSVHIKGAVNFPMEPTWWSQWRKQRALEALLGPDKKRFLVFY